MGSEMCIRDRLKYLWKLRDKCWFKIAFKIHDKSSTIWPIGQTSVQNLQKNNPKSMKMRPWNAFGTKSRPGRPKDAHRISGYLSFWCLSGRKWCPRDTFQEPLGSQNRSKIQLLATWCRFYRPKVASGSCSQKRREL